GTSRVQLGPWVTNTATRHPTVTANVIATLDEMSGGRMFLGIGNGDDSVRTINKPRTTLEELAATVDLIRRLMGGEDVDNDGHSWTLATARPTPPPIYWAASGPRSLRYAGAHADGVIHSAWLVPELMEEDLAHVAKGIAESGREGAPYARIFNTAVAIHPDRQVALEWASGYAARAYIYDASTRIEGWDEEKRKNLLASYDYYKHFSSRNAAAALVPRELITRKVVAGTPDDAVELLTKIQQAGYTHAALIPVGEDFDTVTNLLLDEVLPALGHAGPA
ncbi:MAG: 5,10-methylene tetrahydromethanopterin reductase, partial [Hyphomicrobiales bacterium]|nr:5,10-methylene tetrahydromethanopterin reductase [Hyphomicrobiales bacterium]